eukprot:5817296-Pyramimonas_sp.AAC.1
MDTVSQNLGAGGQLGEVGGQWVEVERWWWALWAGRSKLEVGQVGLKLGRWRSIVGGRRLWDDNWWWRLGIGMSKLDAGQVGLTVDRLRSKAGGGKVEVDSW